MIGLIVSFLCGAVVTLLLVILGAAAWIYSHPVSPARAKEIGPYIQPKLPKWLQEVYIHVNDGSVEVNVESCDWLNVIVDFLFRELRDSPAVKRFVMRKINKEFAEVMMTKPEGRMIEQLTVRDYSFGTSLPVLTSASIVRIQCCEEDENEPVEMDIILDFVYTGGLHLAIDADLVFNKAAYVAVDVLRAKGRGRLQFSRQPFTHWSFALCEDPEFELELHVDSQFEGRNLPQLSSFIESQIRKWIRRKHTLPACKKRFKPFFRKCKPHNQLLDVFVHNHKVTVGQLQVRVAHCTRLTPMEGATKMYCSLGVACTPWQPMVRLWRTQWPVHEISVRRGTCSQQTIGIKYRMVAYVEDEVRHELVLVSRVYSQSAASVSGIKVGDILIRVNNVKVTSVRQVNRLIEKSKGDSVLITVQRPSSHFTLTLLNSGTAPPHTSSSPPLPLRSAPHNTSPPPSDTSPNIPPPQHESEKLATDRETGGATASTVLDTQAEGVRKRKAGQRSLETKGSFSASQLPMDSFDGSGFSAEYGNTLLLMSPPLDQYTFSASENYSTTPPPLHSHLHSHPPTPKHQGHHRHKRPAEDSISLYGVTGERGAGVVSGLGAVEGDELTKPSLLRTTLSMDESAGTRGAEANAEQQPEVNSSSHSGTELHCHTSSSPHTPPPPPPPPHPPPHPPPSTTTGQGENTTDVGGGAAGREHDTSTHVHTTEVSSCKHPLWNECFTFEVGEEDHYLNVCVWNKLSEERGDLLIGHVTIPLMDIALECISTSSGIHHQQYVLTASQPAKAGTSRTVLQATSSSTFSSSSNKKINKEEFPFAGDIFLQFQHSPTTQESSYDGQFHSSSCNDQDDDRRDEDKEPRDKRLEAHHPFTATRGQMPSDHYFIPVDVEGAQQCDICHKRIWGFHVQECQNCQLKCHKKCSQYCKKEVPCYRHSSRHQLIHPSEDEGGNSGDDEASELENEHRHLEQSLVDTQAEANSRTSGESILLRNKEGHPASEDEEREVEECDYRQQSHDHSEANSGKSDSDKAVTADSGSEDEVMERKRALEEFSYNLYSQLPPAEREATLNQKISELQAGIDHINELVNDMTVMLKNPNISPSEAEQINSKMAHHESKLEPLKLLMMQHMFALDQCSTHNE